MILGDLVLVVSCIRNVSYLTDFYVLRTTRHNIGHFEHTKDKT